MCFKIKRNYLTVAVKQLFTFLFLHTDDYHGTNLLPFFRLFISFSSYAINKLMNKLNNFFENKIQDRFFSQSTNKIYKTKQG